MLNAPTYVQFNNDKLRIAAECAQDVNESLMRESGSHVEDLFMMEISAIVLEAIESIEANTNVSHSCFDRISKYVSPNAPTKLLKIGFSLIALLDKLLKDRVNDRNSITFFSAMARKQQVRPTNSKARGTTRILVAANAAPKEIEEAPMGREVKEEPMGWNQRMEPEMMDPEDQMEIKEEEIDDYPDVKEEPLADVYCPSTGASRPLNLDDLLAEERLNSMEDAPCNVLPEQIAGINVYNDNFDDIQSGPSTSKAVPKLYTGYGRECYLCHKHVLKFYSTINLEKRARNKLLDAVRIWSAQDRARVVGLRGNDIEAFFCISHITAAKVPGIPPMTCRTPVQYKPPKLNLIVKPPLVAPKYGRCKCDLCDEPEYPIRISPGTTLRARRYFQNLIDLNSVQQEKVKAFMNNKTKEAKICSKHFRKEVEEEEDKYYGVPTINSTAEVPTAQNTAKPRFAYDLKKIPIKYQTSG